MPHTFFTHTCAKATASFCRNANTEPERVAPVFYEANPASSKNPITPKSANTVVALFMLVVPD